MFAFPNDFNDLCIHLDNIFSFTNILCVNTNSTGLFIDNMFSEKNNVTRIKYTPTTHDTLLFQLSQLNTKFDLICIDPFHEYTYSIHDFNLLKEYLTINGIIISHDCNPPNIEHAADNFPGNNICWCGVTYAAFIEFSYNNPDLYYAVMDCDYGLGIISKTQIYFTEKITNNEKQKQFIDMFKNSTKDAFYYFQENSKEIINLVKNTSLE